jgi:3-hydroxybutyryl-CoA dehydrogenase
MKILIIGDQSHLSEFQLKFGTTHQYSLVGEHRDAEKFMDQNDLIFDFIIEEEPHEFDVYADKNVTVFLNVCKISLAELVNIVDGEIRCRVFGFNGMPTLLNRPYLETSVLHESHKDELLKICKSLDAEAMIVDDRVGMVTPRVIAMIINEAYYTVQEGTASRDGIDLAMRLGTNYPYGPFEWAQRIGIKHVYELLESLQEDTKDERYKICPMLKKEYLRSL